MKQLIAVVAAIASAPALAQRTPYLEEVYRITETGAAFDSSIDQTVSIAAPNDTANPKHWVVERHRTEKNTCDEAGKCMRGTVVTHDWIDGAVCPQVAKALDKLAQLAVPSFAGSRRIPSPYSDHASELTIIGRPQPVTDPQETRPGTIAYVMVRTQFGAFIAWWKTTEAAWQGCWRAIAPLRAGKPATIEIPIQPPLR